uniref:Expressed protein n=1 Tax=Oryza sativa subsp. japonica TaxID=39947 RepID=Q10CR1_ORYSJ|nr:expressed protein [Oryza sativa Japonica Group]
MDMYKAKNKQHIKNLTVLLYGADQSKSLRRMKRLYSHGKSSTAGADREWEEDHEWIEHKGVAKLCHIDLKPSRCLGLPSTLEMRRGRRGRRWREDASEGREGAPGDGQDRGELEGQVVVAGEEKRGREEKAAAAQGQGKGREGIGEQ